MKLRIQHRTDYLYTLPARSNANEVRLQPPHTPWQDRSFWLLKVLPATPVRRFTDLHGNSVYHFEIVREHTKLQIDSTSTVQTKSRYEEGLPLGLPMTTLEDCCEREECLGYLTESTFVKSPPEIWRDALDARDGLDDIFLVAQAIMNRIYTLSSYTAGVTTVETTSVDFFRQKAGVCQDFTHLMLAQCRTLGIPARYVSGYLYDKTKSRLRGAHASHAWVEVYIPGPGWCGMDPTNNLLVDENYVTTAYGRDYADAAPVIGSLIGGGSRQMTVTLWIEEV